MARILLIDDEPSICRALQRLLTDRAHVVEIVGSGELALVAARANPPDAALIDLALPGMNGLDAFLAMRQQDQAMVGIFITAHGSIRSAIAAVRAGGFDYLTKPFDNDELLLTLDRGLEMRRLAREVQTLREEVDGRKSFPGIVGAGTRMQEVLRMLAKIASSDATVLILGESGTGKELVARSLHRQSRRAAGPFVPVNCSAIPSTMIEAEFFGHERGAFTDAKEARIGWFEQARGGTLFLDEVGDLSADAQAKLLRVLEDRQVTRLGSRQPVSVDVRLIAATNKDLEGAQEEGRFRGDLYWRLHVLTVALPPLRERREDLPSLIDFFIDRCNSEFGRSITGVADEARRALLSHDWPGNIRELENALKRAIILADGSALQLGDLPPQFSRRPSEVVPADGAQHRPTLLEAIARATSQVERGMIEATLLEYQGNRSAAADALGINRKTLFNKLRALGLTSQTHDAEPS
jgi:DNA-binding NtrC family response regulator